MATDTDTNFPVKVITVHNLHEQIPIWVDIMSLVYGHDAVTGPLKKAIESVVYCESNEIQPKSFKSMKIIALPFPEPVTEKSVWVEYHVEYYIQDSSDKRAVVRSEYWWDDERDHCEIQAWEIDATVKSGRYSDRSHQPRTVL